MSEILQGAWWIIKILAVLTLGVGGYLLGAASVVLILAEFAGVFYYGYCFIRKIQPELMSPPICEFVWRKMLKR